MFLLLKRDGFPDSQVGYVCMVLLEASVLNTSLQM